MATVTPSLGGADARGLGEPRADRVAPRALARRLAAVGRLGSPTGPGPILARHRARRLGHTEPARRHAERQARQRQHEQRGDQRPVHAERRRHDPRDVEARARAHGSSARPLAPCRSARPSAVPASIAGQTRPLAAARRRPPPTAGSSPMYSSRPKTAICSSAPTVTRTTNGAVQRQVDEGRARLPGDEARPADRTR